MSLPDDEVLKQLPALGGVLVGTLLKLKEGVRVMITFGIAGSVTVLALRGVTDWLATSLHVPIDLAGFLLGALGIATLQKLAETLQQLEIAKPLNGVIERWTGAKAPKE